MPPLKSKDVRSRLESKFGFTRTSRHDHPEYQLVVDDVIVARTHVSHNAAGADIGDRLQSLMARQIGVKRSEFYGMITCTFSRDDLISTLKD